MVNTSEFNVTYFLGAGASAKALPTVNATEVSIGISTRLIEMAEELEKTDYDKKNRLYITKLIDSLRLIAKKTDEFGTPDTYAKFLFLTERNKLVEFKNAISAFFLIEQFVNKKIDNRTLIFLTTIMDHVIFPNNVKILSWNYDFQIQLAAEIFREERYVQSKGASVHEPPLIGYFPTLGYDMSTDINDISMVQLNGIAGSYYNTRSQMFKSFFERKEERTIEHLLSLLTNEEFNNGSLLSFAWESGRHKYKASEFSKVIAANTDVLVIIGYSFPFFNRRIDREIFEEMKKSKKLKTIYYQDPFKSGEFLRNQFELSENIIIKDIKEVENYFVPLEL